MGIDFIQAEFLDVCAKQGGIQDPVLGLGSLTIRESKEYIRAFACEAGYRNLEREGTVRALFRDRYNIDDYLDCDVNGRATLALDLNHPIPADLRGRFGTIVNGGTLEHIFDLKQSMENLHLLIKAGGTLIHMVPLTWYDHGFFNLNPILFHSLVKVNRYSILAEGYYVLAGALPDSPKRPKLFLTRSGEEDPIAAQKMASLLTGDSLPANMMYLVALRKDTDDKFVPPYQVNHGD